MFKNIRTLMMVALLVGVMFSLVTLGGAGTQAQENLENHQHSLPHDYLGEGFSASSRLASSSPSGPCEEGSNVNGHIWVDYNENGELDVGDGRFWGATVDALFPDGSLATSYGTDQSGYFQFMALDPGSYTISLTVPPGYRMSSRSNVGNLPNNNELVITVPPSTNVYNTHRAFGIVPLSSPPPDLPTYNYISGQVFLDNNENGVLDTGEAICWRARVFLDTGEEATRQPYSFNVNDGDYTVSLGVPVGYRATTRTSVPVSVPPSRIFETYVNFGIAPLPTTFEISGNVWVDSDRNGAKDAGEVGYEGATVNLSGPVSATTTTDTSGNFSFANLPAGDYTVSMNATGYVATTVNPVSVTFGPDMTVNFGVALIPGTTIISVPANQAWTDTGLKLKKGDQVTITASGTIFIAASDPGKTPAGDSNCIAPAGFVAPGLPCWSLIGRIGNHSPFEVGTSTSSSMSNNGRLYLGVNDDYFADNSGSWKAAVTILPPLQKGAIVKPSNFIIVPPWASGITHTITNGYGGGKLHKRTNSKSRPNDYYAIDFDFAAGEGVYPAAAGTVVYAGPATGGWSGYGNIVFIDHGNGYQSLYAHLNTTAVSKGDIIDTNMQLGGAGNTGTQTVHLHFALYKGALFCHEGTRGCNGIGPYRGNAVLPEPFSKCVKNNAQSCEGLLVDDQLTAS